MKEPKQKSLLELYKLLWEQIKDEGFVYEICIEITTMEECGLISWGEEKLLIEDVNKHKIYPDTEPRKAFVQRMIKELTHGNDIDVVAK